MPRITDAALILDITPNKGTETCRFSRRYAGALLYFRDSPKLGDGKFSALLSSVTLAILEIVPNKGTETRSKAEVFFQALF